MSHHYHPRIIINNVTLRITIRLEKRHIRSHIARSLFLVPRVRLHLHLTLRALGGLICIGGAKITPVVRGGCDIQPWASPQDRRRAATKVEDRYWDFDVNRTEGKSLDELSFL